MKTEQVRIRTIGVIAIVLAGIAAFVVLGVLLTRGYLDSLDNRLLLAVRATFTHRGLTGFFSSFNILGITAFMTAATIAAFGGLHLLYGSWHRPISLAIAMLGGGGAIALLKYAFARPRPPVEHLVKATGNSFPSGHALITVVYLGLLLAFTWPHLSRPWRRTLAATAVVLVLLTGLSRVYLGLHYPSDVLSGWAFGLAWTAGFYQLAVRREAPATRQGIAGKPRQGVKK